MGYSELKEEHWVKLWIKGLLLSISMVLILTACGGDEPKDPNQVTVFIMGSEGFSQELADQIKQDLQTKLGSTMKITVNTTPIYSAEKLTLEYVDRQDDIIILPENDMKAYSINGGHMVLDKDFDSKTYARGVTMGSASEEDVDKQEKHLFSIPVDQMSMFKQIKYTPDNLYATIPVFADYNKSLKILKAMTE